MKFNFKKSLLVTALSLTCFTVMAGNPNSGGATAAQAAQITKNASGVMTNAGAIGTNTTNIGTKERARNNFRNSYIYIPLLSIGDIV